MMQETRAAGQKMRSVVLIAGTGFATKLTGKSTPVSTRFGTVQTLLSAVGEYPNKVLVYAINRNGKGIPVPSHVRNHRAHLAVAGEINPKAEAIFSITSGGIINTAYSPGDLVLASDALRLSTFFGGQPISFYEGAGDAVQHVDCSMLFNTKLNSLLADAAGEFQIHLKNNAVLAQVSGPHFETPAEARAFGKLGADIVNMTAVSEAVLAAELGIPYAALVVGTNYAAGVNGSNPISSESIMAVVSEKADDVLRLFTKAIEMLAGDVHA